MFLFKVYLGLDTNGHDVDSHKLALDLAAKYFPNGHTVVNANGRWSGSVGIIDEPTLVIEVLAPSADFDQIDHQVRMFAFQYKIDAYQESVLITHTEIEADFV